MHPAREDTLAGFLNRAASATPTPGGGAVAAAGGALGVSMALMAARFTQGKKKFAAVAEEIDSSILSLETLSTELLALIDADMAAYAGVGAAYALPKTSDAEKASRKAAVRSACIEAAAPPAAILAACLKSLRITARLAAIANPMLLSDVGVAAEMLSAAAAAAFLNVKVNADVIRGDEGGRLLQDARTALAESRSLAAAVSEKILGNSEPS
ncbi:MAG: cyclodeaminase/cyclohydrolase family protein [Planctomycetes bacterium]|nr:cyclodeaminase/cyclohydrolase family protein [Planctomycetota bacterium]